MMAYIELRPRALRFCLAGALLGLLSLSRENAMIFAPILLIWAIALTNRTGARSAWPAPIGLTRQRALRYSA